MASDDGPDLRDQNALDPSVLIIAIAEHRDQAAFCRLFESIAPKIKAYYVRLDLSDDLAEDFAQETMLAVWRKASQFDASKSTGPGWIFSIARNLRIDHLRHVSSTQKLPYSDPSLEHPTPEQHFSLHQAEALVRSAVDRLSHEEAEVLRLAFFEDRSHTQIAARLGLPLGTVKSRLRRASVNLRAALDVLA